jgi:hypothetical protein
LELFRTDIEFSGLLLLEQMKKTVAKAGWSYKGLTFSDASFITPHGNFYAP